MVAEPTARNEKENATTVSPKDFRLMNPASAIHQLPSQQQQQQQPFVPRQISFGRGGKGFARPPQPPASSKHHQQPRQQEQQQQQQQWHPRPQAEEGPLPAFTSPPTIESPSSSQGVITSSGDVEMEA